MKSVLESPKSPENVPHPPEASGSDRWSVLHELDAILSSRHFKSADRCKQFLQYVVLSKLDGQTERIKERTIGTEIFKRSPGYATGEDPVVRVQAGEVRRRLENYYQERQPPFELRIELPVGSYSPVFHWRSAAEAPRAQARPEPPVEMPARRWRPSVKLVSLLGAAVLAAFAGRTLFNSLHRGADPKNALEQFWSPAIASHQPILICLANERTSQSEDKSQPSPRVLPGPPQTKSADSDSSLLLNPVEKVSSGNDPVYPEIVPAADASVAVQLSGLFAKLDKSSQLRIGAAATFEDLRNFPAAVIGGFDSRWTIQLVSNLRYAFVWNQAKYMIREQIPRGRTWTTQFGPHGETVEDFAIVSRLIDSKTGQFTVTVAGIGPRGTEAAGELVSSSRHLEEALAKAPADWQNRNLEIVLETTVTDSVSGPPHVIATYAW